MLREDERQKVTHEEAFGHLDGVKKGDSEMEGEGAEKKAKTQKKATFQEE